MTDDERMLAEDRLSRAANALYQFEWAEAIKQGMMPCDYGATMNFLRLKAAAVLKAADAGGEPGTPTLTSDIPSSSPASLRGEPAPASDRNARAGR